MRACTGERAPDANHAAVQDADRPQHRYLLFGTDTDVGKTFVCAALSAALLRAGLRVTACKPLETGGQPNQDDLETVSRLCGRDQRLRTRRGLRYALAAAPTAAAVAERRPPATVSDLVTIVRAAEEDTDAVVAETCGGALTPLSSVELMVDLAPRLPDYQPLLVAGLRLGVLSHSFGAAEALHARGGRPPLIVLNDRFSESPRWYVDSTRNDLRARGLETIAAIGHDVTVEAVDFGALTSITR